MQLEGSDSVASSLTMNRITERYSVIQDIPHRIHNFIPLSDYHYQNEAHTRIFSDEQITWIHEEEKRTYRDHIVVLFIGSLSNRRHVILQMLEQLFTLAWVQGNLSPYIKFYSVCDRVFYYHYDYYVMKAKVIVNIASTNASVFETHRMNYLLSLGKVVISEMGAEESIAERYREGVILVPNNNASDWHSQAQIIFDMLMDVVHDQSTLARQSMKALKLYKTKIRKGGKKRLMIALKNTITHWLH
jgi:hypothetical protein